MGREGGDGWTKQGEHSFYEKKTININMNILALEVWDRGVGKARVLCRIQADFGPCE
jgi:hypothetical protein